MNIRNFEYLRDQIKYTGFGESLENELKTNMEQLRPEFSLGHDTFYNNDRVSATLNFRKSDQTDLYFFNSYKATLEKEGSQEKQEQVFYINRGNNITLKEAYNLMEGRAVNKDLTSREGEVYNAWVQLDFKDADANGNFRLNHYHENYGYDLEAALSRYPIKELKNESHKEDLLNSLKKGNMQSVTFEKGGQETRHYIEANPQFKTLNVYDSDRNRLDTRKSLGEVQAQSKAQDSSRTKNQKAGTEGEADEQPQKQQRGKKQSV